MPVTVEDVRAVARELPRAYEVVVHDRVKFRVGQIVWVAFSRDETTMGFAFPKEEREALVASAPATFLMPKESDLRYRWVVARMAALDVEEMRELVVDAWRMVVPKSVARAYDEAHPRPVPRVADVTDGNEPGPAASSYYVRLPDGRYQPTLHVQGAWNDHEQHMGPVSGLIAHAIDQHEPRPEMLLARICYEILGVIPAEPTSVTVETIRPGRTIELVEATLGAGERPVVRARAWRIARGDTASVAGGLPEPLPPPDSFAPWDGRRVWSGGYIASLDMRGHPQNSPGRGRGWIHPGVPLVEGVDVSPTAAYLGLVDTANGIAVREDPRSWMFPNVDLTVHLLREPVAGWVGFDTTVVFGSDGLGVTSSTLYDVEGPVGRAEQSLTVRPLTRPGT